MNGHLEEELVRVLSCAADTAPLPGEDFAPAVLRRRRSRRRHRVELVAAGCATVLAAALGVSAVSRDVPELESAATGEWSGSVPDLEAAQPAERVWPDAIHKLPGKLPDSTAYSVEAVLGKGRYLVASAGLGKLKGNLSVFDVRTGTVRVLSDLRPMAKAKDFEVTVLGMAGDYAVWTIGINPTSPRHSIELWSAKTDGGGGAKLLTTLKGGLYSRVVDVAGEHIVLAKSESAGRFTFALLPPVGGAPSEVAGSRGFGWIGLGPWVRSGDTSSESEGALLNLLTGERRTWHRHPGDRVAFCDPILCLGESRNGKWTVHRLDGSDYQETPYDYSPAVDKSYMKPVSQAEGRIGTWNLVTPGKGGPAFVWDRISGKAGSTPGSVRKNDTLAQWTDSRGRVMVLEFSAMK